MSTISCLST